MTPALFILQLHEAPQFFFAVVITVVISITLHELAHGWMAIRHGDDTPIRAGHMTGNPLVHMGVFSIVVLLIVGIAWGAMPIDPTRMRGRYAEAKVAAAGPATNLLLSLAALTALGLWMRFGTMPQAPSPMENLRFLLWVFGFVNLALCLFNLLPIPPLDGSHILANFHRGYARFIANPHNQGVMMLMFFFIFMLGTGIFTAGLRAGRWYLGLIAGM